MWMSRNTIIFIVYHYTTCHCPTFEFAYWCYTSNQLIASPTAGPAWRSSCTWCWIPTCSLLWLPSRIPDIPRFSPLYFGCTGTIVIEQLCLHGNSAEGERADRVSINHRWTHLHSSGETEKAIADLNTNSADIFWERRPGISREKPRQWQTCRSAYIRADPTKYAICYPS